MRGLLLLRKHQKKGFASQDKKIDDLEQEVAQHDRRWRLVTGKPATAELDKRALYLDILTHLFSMDDLVSMTFQLHIDHELLNTETKQIFAREIILYCTNNGRLESLYHLVQEKRPFLFQK